MSLSRFFHLLIGSAAIIVSGSAPAIIVDSLYDAELPIYDRSAEQRDEIIKKAFENVLTRVSGTTQVLSIEDIEQSVAEYEKYVSRYTYKRIPKQGLQLQVMFDENMVNGLLEKAQQAYIHKNRPLTLFLLVKEEQGQLKMIGGESDAGLTSQIERMAEQRGIPVVLPLMDLTDQNHFQPQDILARDIDALQSTVQRYGAEEVIVGKVSELGAEYQVDWQFMGHETPANQSAAQESLEQAFHAVFENMVTYFHAQYSNKNDPQGQMIELQVTGIQSLQDYAKISAYLRQLAAIHQVNVVDVLPSQVTFQVQTSLDQEALSAVLNREPLLKRFAKESPIEANEISQKTEGKEPLTYKLNT